jgi:hypothetical protein
MTVLTPSNAFPGGAFPQHLLGQTATVQNYLYPGAVQVKSTGPAVLSYTNAFPGGAFPQHLSGQATTVQSYFYPGAVQPQVQAGGAPFQSPLGWAECEF